MGGRRVIAPESSLSRLRIKCSFQIARDVFRSTAGRTIQASADILSTMARGAVMMRTRDFLFVAVVALVSSTLYAQTSAQPPGAAAPATTFSSATAVAGSKK